MAEPDAAPARVGHTVVSVRSSQLGLRGDGDVLLLFGGVGRCRERDQLLPLNETFVLDLTPRDAPARWERFSTVGLNPAPRTMHGACVLGDEVFVVGGSGSTRLLPDVCVLELGGAAGPSRWRAPAELALVPGPAARRSHSVVALSAEELLLFGGDVGRRGIEFEAVADVDDPLGGSASAAKAARKRALALARALRLPLPMEAAATTAEKLAARPRPPAAPPPPSHRAPPARAAAPPPAAAAEAPADEPPSAASLLAALAPRAAAGADAVRSRSGSIDAARFAGTAGALATAGGPELSLASTEVTLTRDLLHTSMLME